MKGLISWNSCALSKTNRVASPIRRWTHIRPPRIQFAMNIAKCWTASFSSTRSRSLIQGFHNFLNFVMILFPSLASFEQEYMYSIEHVCLQNVRFQNARRNPPVRKHENTILLNGVGRMANDFGTGRKEISGSVQKWRCSEEGEERPARLLLSTVLPKLAHVSKRWALWKQDEHLMTRDQHRSTSNRKDDASSDMIHTDERSRPEYCSVRLRGSEALLHSEVVENWVDQPRNAFRWTLWLTTSSECIPWDLKRHTRSLTYKSLAFSLFSNQSAIK